MFWYHFNDYVRLHPNGPMPRYSQEAAYQGLTPSRTNTEDWDVLPKDYVLYCVKYMNPWQAKYVRRGVDNITENGVTTINVRRDTTLH